MNRKQLSIYIGLFTFSIVCGVNHYCFGQEGEKQIKPNRIELSYPVYHFFDGTDTRLWLYQGWGEVEYFTEPVIVFLVHSGITYTRFNVNKGNGIQVSLKFFTDDYHTLQPFHEAQGAVLLRYFTIGAVSYHHPIYSNDKILLWSFAGLDFRYGWETYHVAFSSWGEHLLDGRNLADLGPSIGLKLSKPLPWNFHIGTEAKYTRFFYRRDKGNPYYRFDKGASPNLLTVQLNVGYRF